jgi:hypothetical protein
MLPAQLPNTLEPKKVLGTNDPLELDVTDTVFASGQKCHKIATHPNASNEPSTFFTHAQLSGSHAPRRSQTCRH